MREWLKSLDPAERQIIGEDIKDVEFSWPIGMPLVRSQSAARTHRARAVLPGKDCMVLLHGFMKKTQTTPQQDIDLALRRKEGVRK